MAASKRLTGRGIRAKVRGHEPTTTVTRESDPFLPALGVQGAFLGERPPVDAPDELLDKWAEECYNKSMETYVAGLSLLPRPRRRRSVGDYKAKNCEEALGERWAA